MKVGKELVQRALGAWFPEQRKWIVRVLVLAGLPMLSAPLWEPYLNAALAKSFDVSVTTPNAMVGGILLALGIMGAIANVVLDRKDKRIAVSQEDVADKKTLTMLFSEIYLPTLDTFIDYGKKSVIYIPVLHYFFGVDAVIRSSAYHLHDPKLREAVGHFHAALSKALSYGEYFVEMPNDTLQKFDSRHDVHVDPQAKAAHEDFIQAVWDTEHHIKVLCQLVQSKYLDFDLSETNRRALEDYRHHQAKVANEVSDWEFSVMNAIIEMEEIRETPTLQNLSATLKRPSVDVRVALDKLIGLNYVKHLYPGAPWQKYTVLADGRAYYVLHRGLDGQE